MQFSFILMFALFSKTLSWKMADGGSGVDHGGGKVRSGRFGGWNGEGINIFFRTTL
jgi:hypothetical protein